MKPIRIIAPGICLLLAVATLQAKTLNVPAERYRPAQQTVQQSRALKLPVTASQRKTLTDNRLSSLTLAAPQDAELQSLLNQHGQHKSFRIGISRELPALPDAAEWLWQAVAGGQAGQFTIISEQAARLRILLQISEPLPSGTEIRIYDPADNSTVSGPYTQQNFTVSQTGGPATFWTPTLAGEQLGIEVFVPDNADPATLKLAIPRLSHIAYDMSAGQFRNLKSANLKVFGSCDVSIACAPQQWQETARSVARYIYTGTDGSTYLCSGTLMADLDQTTQIPYFLTAAHCISDSSTAASMDFFWSDQESSCGADDANPVQVSGGAVLLHSESGLDSTLVKMNNSPPADTLMSGWSLEPLASPDAVAGIHHALGNPKQFASGNFSAYTRIAAGSGGYTIYQDPLGDFFQVYWNQGITSPGSSGSGLWAVVDGQHLLKGNLLGGSSSCSTPDAADDYARLDRFYPYIADWLGTIPTPLQSFLDNDSGLKALTDGVLLGRYLAGIRGMALVAGISDAEVDINALEERLAEAATNMDFDQDGSRTRNEDALLLARYLVGLRGSSLIEGIDLNQSANNTAEPIISAIEAFLQGE